jgi:hypothetical protein
MQVDSESADELPPSLLVMIVIKGQVERPSEARIILYGDKSTVLLTISSRLGSQFVGLSCLVDHTSDRRDIPPASEPPSQDTAHHWDNRNSSIQFLHPSSISRPS